MVTVFCIYLKLSGKSLLPITTLYQIALFGGSDACIDYPKQLKMTYI